MKNDLIKIRKVDDESCPPFFVSRFSKTEIKSNSENKTNFIGKMTFGVDWHFRLWIKSVLENRLKKQLAEHANKY